MHEVSAHGHLASQFIRQAARHLVILEAGGRPIRVLQLSGCQAGDEIEVGAGTQAVFVLHVPGVFDMPLAVKVALERLDIDGVVALGAVIEGETAHDEVVIQHCARKLVDLSLEYSKPVGLGITGPGMSRLQAEARIERAKAAVETVVKLHRSVMDIRD